MKVKLGWLFVGIVAGSLVAIPSGAVSNAATGPATIRITNQEVKVVKVDIGARGTSPGDVEVLRQSLFNRRLTPRPIGHVELICTFVDSGRTRDCRGTYFLPRGRLIVGGSLRFRQFYELAVIGGTGLYDNARGTMTVTRTHRKPVRDLVIFRLVG